MITYKELKCVLTNSNSKVSPLANDLSVRFDQIIRHVSASQILQCVFVTDLHLDTKNSKQLNNECSTFLGFGFRSCFIALTCGGGRPPAPAGHSGNILFCFPQLHSQSGDGFSMVQLPLSKMSLTVWGTWGIAHSSSTAVQGVSLEHRNTVWIFK